MSIKKSDIKEDLYRSTEMTLKCVALIQSRIESMKMKLKWMDDNDGVKGIDYSADNISSGKICNVTESIVFMKMDEEEHIKEYIKQEELKLKIIEGAINGLEDVDAKIIRLRYFEGLEWAVIGKIISYEERQCRVRKNKSIAELAIIFYGDRALVDYRSID